MRPHEFDGSHWDTGQIRRERELGWFRQNEAKIIEAARRKRAADEKRRRTKEAESRRLMEWHKCPKCGGNMRLKMIEDFEGEECNDCAGVFFDHGELERLFLKYDERRHGLLRRLLGSGWA